MAVRSVEILVSVNDDDANKRLDALAAKLDRLTKRDWTIKLRLDDGGMGARLDKMGARLDKMSKQTISPKFDPRGLKAANAQLDKLDARLRDRTVRINVKVDSNAAGAAVSAAAGRAAGRSGGDRGGPGAGWLTLLSLLRGGGGSGGGGFASLFGQGAGTGGGAGATAGRFAASPVGAGVIASLIGPLSSLIDAFTGLGIGGAAGAGLFGLTSHFNPKMLAPGTKDISQTFKGVAGALGPSVGMMMESFGTSVQTMAPMLTKMFASSLPFIQQFLSLMTMAAKTIMPAMTQAMQSMVKSGSLNAMMQGFAAIVKGVAGFITALGPGMKAGALTFRAIAMGIEGLLRGLGLAFGYLGKQTGQAYTQIHGWWDKLRHNTAVIFDGIRHEVAHVWDSIYQATIAKVVEMYRDVVSWETKMRHDIATDFDLLRHYISSVWDQIWSDTIGKVQRGVAAVVKWFHSLPSSVQSVLSGLGKMLFGIASGALGLFLSGLEQAAGPIIGFVQHLASIISGILGSIGGAISSVGSGISGITSRVIPHARGGIIAEPIIGRGLHTGAIHTFGENGIREKVTPLGAGGAGGGGGGDTYYIYPPESATNPDAYALTVIQAVRKYKMRHGNAIVGIA